MRGYAVSIMIAIFYWCTSAWSQEPRSQTYDLVIRGGRIVDGTGNPWFEGEVGIRGDRIVAVGRVVPEGSAKRVIDAKGLIVAPGFIDMHSHSDMVLLEDGAAHSKIRDGVTTEILGEDSSAGPRKGKHPVGGGSGEEGDIDGAKWTTLGGYFGALAKKGIAVNVASYVGMGTLLRCVMGDSLRRPTDAELAEMKVLLEEGMNEGALGLSTMLAGARELAVTTDDIVELAKVVKRHGGLYSSHIRNEGTEVIAGVKEAIEVGRRSGVTVDIIHLKIAESSLWGQMNGVVGLIEEARQSGVNVQANVYPYTRGNNDLVTIIPPWAHEGGKEVLVGRLRDRAARERLKREIRGGLPGWYDHYTAVGGDWSRMLISAKLSERNRRFEGKTMDLIVAARSEGVSPTPDSMDVLFDFLTEENGSIGTIYAHHTEEDMNLAMVQPWCSIGSDGSALAVEGPLRRGHPHPRNFGTFARVMGVYVRERAVLRLEDAVRKVTSLNAAKAGLVGRGSLVVGGFADLTIFDPSTIIDRSTYGEPFRYSSGIIAVVVNGQVALDGGAETGVRAGRALLPGR